MNFKDLTPKEGERYIIVENGKPTSVLISFEDYQKMNSSKSVPAKATPHKEEVEELKDELKRELTVDDLPF